MNRQHRSAIIIPVIIALGAIACERSTTTVVILLDRSLSFANGCPSVVGAVEALRTQVGRESNLHVTVLGTGGADSANEPVTIGTAQFGAIRRVLEGRHREEREGTDALRRLDERCRATAPASRSPIGFGIRRSIEHLRASSPCGNPGQCRVVAVSDAMETEQSEIKAALLDARAPAPQGIIDNRRVSVTFCGLSAVNATAVVNGKQVQVVAPRALADAGRVEAVWRATFTDPSAVSFAPTCPMAVVPNPPPAAEGPQP